MFSSHVHSDYTTSYSHSLISPSHEAVINFDYVQTVSSLPTEKDTRETHMLMRQPHMINHHLLMRIQPLQNLAALPIPEDNVALSVTGREESTVRGEADSACVAGDRVACKTLFTVLSEAVGRVDEDLVVEGLGGEPFVCGRARASARVKEETTPNG